MSEFNTPWSALDPELSGDAAVIVTSNGRTIWLQDAYHLAIPGAIRDRIVTAVNQHDAIVEQRDRLAGALTKCQTAVDSSLFDMPLAINRLDEINQIASEAIAECEQSAEKAKAQNLLRVLLGATPRRPSVRWPHQ